jgi:uncharacterized iron-regulated membrane protein
MRSSRRLFTKVHRWITFALGLVLLAVVVSGVLLVFGPEIEQVTHPSLYDTASGPAKLSPAQALAVARRDLPKLEWTGAEIYDQRGAWEVHSASGQVARVDDTDGRLLGTIDREHGFMAFMENLHECGFTCEGESGYIGFLNKPAQVWGFDLTLGNEGTWGTIILAVSALVLLALVITGAWIWWPRKGAWKRSLRLRRGAGRYKFHYDLHKIVGVVALPALFMWALTGINFELPKQTEGAFYAVTPGSPAPESIYEFESRPGAGRVSMAEAVVDAEKVLPGGAGHSKLDSVNSPDPAEEGSYYEVWFSHGIDTYRYSQYPGNFGVYVDRHSGAARQFFPNPDNATVTNEFIQNWAGALHMGMLVGWLPRTLWFVFGVTPVLLALTGIVTWLIRRRRRARKVARFDADLDELDGSEQETTTSV